MSTSGGNSGGGGVIQVQSFALATIDANAVLNDTADFFGPLPQAARTVTGAPILNGAGSNVVANLSVAVLGLDTTDDSYDLAASLYVTDLAGTNVLLVSATATAPQVGPEQQAIIDWSTATATQLAGTDLSWDGLSAVMTTLGGVFVVSLSWSAAND